MFFRLKKSGERAYVQIVENKRVDGAVRQSLVATIGRADELAASGALASPLASGAKLCGQVLLIQAFDENADEAGFSPTARSLGPKVAPLPPPPPFASSPPPAAPPNPGRSRRSQRELRPRPSPPRSAGWSRRHRADRVRRRGRRETRPATVAPSPRPDLIRIFRRREAPETVARARPFPD